MWYRFAAVMWESWEQLGVQVARVLPNVLAALMIAAGGVIVASLCAMIARRAMVVARVDRVASRLGVTDALARVGVTSVAQFVERALKWSIVAAALVPALYTLDARVASDLVGRVLLYAPHVAVAVVLVWFGTLLSRFAARGVLIAAVNRELISPRLLAAATRVGIMLVTIAIATEHIGIGQTTVLIAFAILFGGVTLAAAIAVGLGSKDIVRDWLSRQLRDRSRTSDASEPIQHW
jgi:hypothetical protein